MNNQNNQGYNFDDDQIGLDIPSEPTPEMEALPEPQGGNFMEKFKTTYVYYLAIVVILVVVGFIIYKAFFDKGTNQVQQQTQSFSSLQATGNTPAASDQNMTMTPVMAGDPTQAMITSLAKAEGQSMQALTAQVQTLVQNSNISSQAMAQLASQMQQLDNKLDAFNQSLSQVAQGLTQTQAELQLVLAQSAQNASKLALRAIVPGRAWLVDDKGNTTSVAVGDTLPYYGKVTNIDANAGTVQMSSGYIFQ